MVNIAAGVDPTPRGERARRQNTADLEGREPAEFQEAEVLGTPNNGAVVRTHLVQMADHENELL